MSKFCAVLVRGRDNSHFYHKTFFITVEDFLWKIIGNRITIQGLNLRPFYPEWPAARLELVKWIKEVCVTKIYMLTFAFFLGEISSKLNEAITFLHERSIITSVR